MTKEWEESTGKISNINFDLGGMRVRAVVYTITLSKRISRSGWIYHRDGHKEQKRGSCLIEQIFPLPITALELTRYLVRCGRSLLIHSLRGGGATYLAGSGVEWTELKMLGRWKSDIAPRAYTQHHVAASINRAISVLSRKINDD